MTRGLFATLLTVAVVIPYSHPALCAAAGHEADRATALVTAIDARASHEHDTHDESCHDDVACTTAPVAVALRADVAVPTAELAEYDLLPTTQRVAQNTSPPLTPPPRA